MLNHATFLPQEQGEIREAKISREEPEWSVNLKKALAVLFQAKFDVASWLSEEKQQEVFFLSYRIVISIGYFSAIRIDLVISLIKGFQSLQGVSEVASGSYRFLQVA